MNADDVTGEPTNGSNKRKGLFVCEKVGHQLRLGKW